MDRIEFKNREPITFEDITIDEEFLKSTLEIPSYDRCLELVEEFESFDYVDETANGVNTRTFGYRLGGNPIMWTKRCARNMRGIVFDRDTKQLLALPMPKFFNLNENSFTLESYVKNWKIKKIYNKEDGTLIYFYRVNKKTICRTKRKCESHYTRKVERILSHYSPCIKQAIEYLLDFGWTPMFELVSPTDPLIVHYDEDKLFFIGIRNMKTGEFLYYEEMIEKKCIAESVIDALYHLSILSAYDDKNIKELKEICNDEEKDIEKEYIVEGYVIHFENGEFVKMKTDQYMNFFAKFDAVINLNDRVIIDLIFSGAIDDIVAEYIDNKPFIDFVNEITEKFNNSWTKAWVEGKKFWEANKHLGQKEFFELNAKVNGKTRISYTAGEYYTCITKNGKTDARQDRVKRNFLCYRGWRSDDWLAGRKVKWD